MDYRDLKPKQSAINYSNKGDTRMTNQDLRDAISKQLGFPNKIETPTSFSAWLEQNGDAIDDPGGNIIPNRVQSNHDIYDNGNPFG